MYFINSDRKQFFIVNFIIIYNKGIDVQLLFTFPLKSICNINSLHITLAKLFNHQKKELKPRPSTSAISWLYLIANQRSHSTVTHLTKSQRFKVKKEFFYH